MLIQIKVLIIGAFLIYVSGCANTISTETQQDRSKQNLWSEYPSLYPVQQSIKEEPVVESLALVVPFPPLSIKAYDVEINALLTELFKGTEFSFFLNSSIEGRATIQANELPLNVVLDELCNQLQIEYIYKDDTFIFSPIKSYWQSYSLDYVHISKTSVDSIDMQMSVANAKSQGQKALSNTQVKVTAENNFWQSVQRNLENFIVDGSEQKLVVSPETGTVTVFAPKSQQYAISTYLQKLKTRINRQVMIEATVVEVALNDEFQSGIDWKIFNSALFNGDEIGLSLTSPLAPIQNGYRIETSNALGELTGVLAGNLNILASVELLQQFGDSTVLSSPKVMVLNNQTALLKVVNNLVYFTMDINTTNATATSPSITTYQTAIHTVPVGFTMSVTPFVGDGAQITLNIRPTISRHIGEVQDPNPDLANAGVSSAVPIIQEKEMSSVLRLQNQQTVIIGGLIEQETSDLKAGLPGTQSMGVLDFLFNQNQSKSSKTELVIFIRPTIV